MPIKTAKIWKFFSVVNVEGEAKRKCMQCFKCLPVPPDASTSSMINHLKTKGHERMLKEYEQDDETPTVPKITSFFGQKQVEFDRQQALDEQLVRIMVRQNASMYFFDDEDVQDRTQKAYPDLKVFGRLHYVREVIPRMAAKIKSEIVQNIGIGNFSITSDGWQKPSKFPALLSVTTHTVNENFERFDNVLATIEMKKEHTGDEIAHLIEECMLANRLEMSKLVAMVRDDASNMQKSCRLLEIDSFQCSAHFYHLVVTEALKRDELICELIRTVRQWVGGTHRSSLADLLKRFQISEGFDQNRIPIDIATRWNSTYLMLLGFLDNKNALLKAADFLLEVGSSRRPAHITQTNWTTLKRLAGTLTPLKKEDFSVIKVLCKLLKVFQVETCRLSVEQSTASTYLPTVIRILEYVSNVAVNQASVKNVQAILVENLQRRMAVVQENKLLNLSMLVDPRFCYNDDFLQSYEWDFLEEECIERFMKLEQAAEGNAATVPIEDEFHDFDEENSMDTDIWTTKKSSWVPSDSQREMKASIKAELSHYRHNSDRPERSVDIFQWWAKNKDRFPLIAKVARILLCVSATSVSSERVFSNAGLLLANTLRNRLQGKTAEMLILIKANLKKLKLAPATTPDEEEVSTDEPEETEDNN